MRKKEFLYFEIKNISTGLLTAGFLYWICKTYGVEDFVAKALGCLIVNLYFIRATEILEAVTLFLRSRK